MWPAEGISIGGEDVTINGSNFQEGLTVTFGDVEPLEVTRVSATQISVTTPGHAAGDVTIKVTNPDGLPAFYEYFTYIPVPPPRIALLIPDRGHTAGGTTVQLRGNYFQPGIRVYFGGIESSSVTYHGLKVIEAVTPSHAVGTVNVLVRNTDGQQFTLSSAFTYLPDPAPELTGVSPSEGPAGGGTQITVSGSNFRSGAVVWIGGNLASSIAFVSTTELTCRTPAADPEATFVSVRVENPDGQYAWLPSEFRYVSGVVSCDRGDANGDGTLNIADGMAILEYLFRGGQSVYCVAAADYNGDGTLNVADAISLLSYLFPNR